MYKFQLIIIYQYWFLNYGKCIIQDIRQSRYGVYENTVYYLYNFPLNQKVHIRLKNLLKYFFKCMEINLIIKVKRERKYRKTKQEANY